MFYQGWQRFRTHRAEFERAVDGIHFDKPSFQRSHFQPLAKRILCEEVLLVFDMVNDLFHGKYPLPETSNRKSIQARIESRERQCRPLFHRGVQSERTSHTLDVSSSGEETGKALVGVGTA